MQTMTTVQEPYLDQSWLGNNLICDFMDFIETAKSSIACKIRHCLQNPQKKKKLAKNRMLAP